ncbi:MAG: T9SS type A sorting domain-containing protein [Bacteroidales bacterium]|nr:T9SS type A sorting domain-containing protein [Bacteroidales bacterium]
MKKVLLSLVFVALSVMTYAQKWTSLGESTPTCPEVTLVSSSEQQVVVDFTLGGFNMTKVETPNGIQQVVSVPEMATMLEAGAPDLPQFPVPAIIGDMAEMQVSIVNSTFTDYENVEVAPSKGNFSRQIDPASVPYTYGEMYNQNAFYPAEQAVLESPYILRDYRGQNIMVRPFAYNPVTKTLRVYHHMTIAMNKVSDNGENPKTTRKSIQKVAPETKAAYQSRFINYKECQTRYNFIEDRGEMLVICADQFMAKMQAFVDWKNQSGRPTTMVSVTEVGGNSDNAIKSYITNLYNDPEHNLVYVLFVGDYEHITPHSVSGERSDNWFGQVAGSDHYPEVFIGRFSVQNDLHVESQVNKVIYYERDLRDNTPEKATNELTWVNKGLGIGYIGAGNGHYGEDDYQHIDLIRDTLEHYTYEHVTELHGGGGGASTTSISNTINDGVSIINYCNHGSETSWGVANYSTSHVNALVNDNKWPIVWSVACLCGKFNYGGANGECFAEAWMRATDNTTGVPTGAIGGMFSWMSQPWIPPMYGQDEMVDILCEWRSTDLYNHTLGAASLNGNMNVIDMSGSQGYDTHDTWVLFGDPSLMVRTDNPVSMNITLQPAVLMIGMSELEITAENTPFGIATLMMDGEVLASSYIEDGSCTLSFPPMSNVGDATLTVMGYNKITEIMTVPVLPAEGPYVTVTNFTPNFAPVNVETSLTMSFKNVGVDPTNGNTNVTLSCADDRVEILNSTAQFGVLPADESITLQDAFSFIVAEGVEDGTRFQIDVEMTDGRQTWSGRVFITAGQASLDYSGAEWAGSYVPGDELTILANFKNIGHYMATNAIATIACESEYVTLLNPTIEFGTIDPEGTAPCVFHIAIDPECPATQQIPISFTMQADGEIFAEGSIILKNSCIVIVEMTDSYGDGWNGNKLRVAFDDGTPSVDLTLTDGNSGTETLEIGSGVHVTLTWVNGQYAYECSFVMKYEDGTIIYQGSNLSAGVLHEFDCNCNGEFPGGNFNPGVENLMSSVEIGSVILTWDAPADALDYTVYRNGIQIAQVEEPAYVDQVFSEIHFTYCVVANYESGSSYPECIDVKGELSLEENESEFAIYPNPTNGTLYINGGNTEYSYVMYNGMGQVVANGNAKGTEQISVEGMTKGVYFLRLTSGTQVLVEKVVVK